MKSLILLSGGLDSCTALAIAKHQDWNPELALTVSYGQRHKKEISSALKVACHYNVEWEELDVPIVRLIKDASALLNPEEELPANRPMEEMTEIPRSYVPGRNSILLAIAQSIAEARGLDRIVTGFNAVDYSGYPDCRPEFLAAWNSFAVFATREGVEGRPICVYAPIIRMTKTEIVRRALELDAPLSYTWSCYAGKKKACGTCDSCIIRRAAFRELGEEDPIAYEQ